jgi:hypothetical protein
MPGISTPFPDIAMHIIKSKSIRGKLPNWGSFLSIFAFGFISVGIAGIVVSIVVS